MPAHEATLTADEGYEMDLIGNLSVFNPALVLQAFNLSSLSGELRFVISGNTASFYFKDGHLIYASADNNKKKIGQFLVEREWITMEQLNWALQIFRKESGRKRIGQILAEHGFLDYADLVSAVHEQIREVVFEVLSWEKGHFVYHDKVYPESEDILVDERLDYLILEGLARLDEAKGSS